MQNYSRVIFCWMDMEVLWESEGSCSSLLLTMRIAGSTGTNEKGVLTS